MSENTEQVSTVGEVRADCLYTLEEIQKRLKLGQHAMRQAKRKGLVVRMIGRRGYVLGKDMLEYVEQHAKVQGGGEGGSL